MAPRIKNCGLSTEASIAEAAATGAQLIGFVHHPASPRHLAWEQGKALRTAIPQSIAMVAVLVDPSDNLLEQAIQAWSPAMLQLHAIADAQRLHAIRARYALPIILGWPVASTADIAATDAYHGVVDYLLLDKKKSGEHGGTGESFDWQLPAQRPPALPWFLAGGLTPENVAEAIAVTRPYGVDVSSGIESSPGVKSLEKIAAFNRAVLDGAHDR